MRDGTEKTVCLIRWALVSAVLLLSGLAGCVTAPVVESPKLDHATESSAEVKAGEPVAVRVCGFPLFVIVKFQDGASFVYYGESLLMFRDGGEMTVLDWEPDLVCRAIYESQLPGA